MCDVNKLKGKIVENKLTQEELAKKISIDRSTLNRKLKTGEAFTIGEANRIVTVLKLTSEEAVNIFLPSVSHKCDFKEG